MNPPSEDDGYESLCPEAELAELEEGRARGFRLRDGRGVILLRWQGRLLGYRNVCPHRGTPLDLAPDHFFDREGRHLVCATHGALFRPEDGACVAGPCRGEALEEVAVTVRDGVVAAAILWD